MITVPARRVKQFGVEFYQAGLSAKDIDRLVKFEVLGYSGGPRDETPKKNRSGVRSRVNWDMLEKRIAESETAYQRPVIRRKIDELVTYYKECKDAGTLPAIPGAVIITSEKRFTFTPVAGHHDLGLLQIPEEHGVLRVLDGQHRLLALHALSQNGEAAGIEVPAVLFDSLDARQIVELFVTINAKHTRLDPYEPNGIREAIKPWGERLRDRRFETEGEWKLKLAGGTRGTVDTLSRELRDALR